MIGGEASTIATPAPYPLSAIIRYEDFPASREAERRAEAAAGYYLDETAHRLDAEHHDVSGGIGDRPRLSRFAGEGGTYSTDVYPVVGWDADGECLVLDPTTGRPIPAVTLVGHYRQHVDRRVSLAFTDSAAITAPD